jgi:hypothetical protein
MRIVILGAGFGGLSVARGLVRRGVYKKHEIVLVDKAQEFCYMPWLFHCAVGGKVGPSAQTGTYYSQGAAGQGGLAGRQSFVASRDRRRLAWALSHASLSDAVRRLSGSHPVSSAVAKHEKSWCYRRSGRPAMACLTRL